MDNPTKKTNREIVDAVFTAAFENLPLVMVVGACLGGIYWYYTKDNMGEPSDNEISIAALDRKARMAENKIALLRRKVEEAEERIAALEVKHAELQNQVNTLQQNVVAPRVVEMPRNANPLEAEPLEEPLNRNPLEAEILQEPNLFEVERNLDLQFGPDILLFIGDTWNHLLIDIRAHPIDYATGILVLGLYFGLMYSILFTPIKPKN
jgi:hypothetical protein